MISEAPRLSSHFTHPSMVDYDDRPKRPSPQEHQGSEPSSSSYNYTARPQSKPVETQESTQSPDLVDASGSSASGTPPSSQHSPPQDITSSSPKEHDKSTPSSPKLLPTIRSSLSFTQSHKGSPTRIRIRDLNHIHSFASQEALAVQKGSQESSILHNGQQYEISEMPVTDIIEMVAGLLTKITTQNDLQHQHEHINRHIPPSQSTSALGQQTASVLSFHGKNVPNISILSYLTRIHKYCPTTYEVFLSLLVYLDRMASGIKNGTRQSFKSAARSAGRDVMSPASGPADLDSSSSSEDESISELAHSFVVDSFNIHRLVIAGVTCASKFFSDVFYTNSRYAKVSLCTALHCYLICIGWWAPYP